MLDTRQKSAWIMATVLCIIILIPLTLQAAGPMALKAVTGSGGDDAAASEDIELPADLETASIEKLMATMSDDQVRRLLLQELQKQAQEAYLSSSNMLLLCH